jgi:ribonucleoside-diphosphate reductase alpha chain
MKLSDTAEKVLRERYYLKDKKGNVVEDWEALCYRVAHNIVNLKDSDHLLEQEVFEEIYNLRFLPNSPTLMNAGTKIGQLSACFVLPIEDSMESIFTTLKNTALIHKTGGGTGFDFSKLRSKGSMVSSTHGVASGVISFMSIFDAATNEIKQGGRRRGANMGVLNIRHPEIKEFITVKSDLNKLNNFNISVMIPDAFIQAVKEKKPWALIDPNTGQTVEEVDANELFDMIAEQAWKTGEPGVLFYNTINKHAPTSIRPITATNPCGELPLPPYGSCNLGSINLAKFINPHKTDFDYMKLKITIDLAVYFLNKVIDANKYPLPQIEHVTKLHRMIGLGVMGLADALIQLGIPYNSAEGLVKAEQIMEFIQTNAHEASKILGQDDGCVYEDRRNTTITCIAPTGTLSMIANCSSGIEPLFALSYTKTVMDGKSFTYINEYLLDKLKELNLDKEEIIEEIKKTGSIQHIKEIPNEIKRIFVTAMDIDYKDHIKMQAIMQRYTDSSISKTINFKNNMTVKDIKDAIIMAHELGCKGITVYRDGSRMNQVLTVAESKKEDGVSVESPQDESFMQDRPNKLEGITKRVKTGCGNFYITINKIDGKPVEVLSHIGKAGGCAICQGEAICRLVSLGLRAGITPNRIVKQLHGIRCPSPTWYEGNQILSCPDAIAQTLKEEFNIDMEVPQPVGQIPCPECGAEMKPDSGCFICTVCGYSKCS